MRPRSRRATAVTDDFSARIFEEIAEGRHARRNA